MLWYEKTYFYITYTTRCLFFRSMNQGLACLSGDSWIGIAHAKITRVIALSENPVSQHIAQCRQGEEKKRQCDSKSSNTLVTYWYFCCSIVRSCTNEMGNITIAHVSTLCGKILR